MLKKVLFYISLFLLTAAFTSDAARDANEAYERGDFAEAERLYKMAIESNPDEAKLYFNLANALAQQGKTEEAVQAYKEFRSRTEQPVEKAAAEFNLGSLMAKNEDWETAALHFRNALKMNPADEDARFNYELALKKKEEGEQEQQQQENQPPPIPSEYAKAMKKQAEKLVNERKYNEAYNLMMNALKADDTVRAFNTFINRIKEVADINTN